MIVRTYQRRNRGSRSLSDSGNLYGDGVGSSGSQESLWGSSQETPFSFPSSQESCWSQSDYGNNSRSFKSTRRQSQGDDFGEEKPIAPFSRPPISRSFSERPALNSGRRNDDSKPVRGKLKKARSEVQQLHSKGSKLSSDGGLADLAGSSRARREAERVDAINNGSHWDCPAPTSTLMETQESGEMMEHVDEANFALDGLRQGQPVRIQRASLTSLLSLCGSVQRRRMLRTQGMAKPLLDAIVALPTDDPPLALAAAAVLYFLAIDSQDDDLLDSEPCVLFLMKLLDTSPPQPIVKKGLSGIGSRLAAFSKSTLPKSGSSFGGVERGAAVETKVRDLFKTIKEHGIGGRTPGEEHGDLFGEELSSKWLALLTLEKACISTVVLEDSSAEAVRKVGGQFKERLRELGGLDALCDLACSCLVNLMEALKTEGSDEMVDLELASLEKNQKSGGVGVLLRCLRVMENVTFLSEQNQKHLLELKLPRGKGMGTECFIGLTINAINTLSELAKRQEEQKEAKLKIGLSVARTESPILPSESEGSLPVKGKRQRSITGCFRAMDDSFSNEKDDFEISAPLGSGNHCSSVLTFKRRRSFNLGSQSEIAAVSERSQITMANVTDSKDTQNEAQSRQNCQTMLFKQKGLKFKTDKSQKAATESNGNEFSKLADDKSEQISQKRTKESKRSPESTEDPFAFDDMERAIEAGNKHANSQVEDSQDPFAFDDMDIDFKSFNGLKKKPKKDEASKSKSATRSKKAGSYSRLALIEEPVLGKPEVPEDSKTIIRGSPDGQEQDGRFATLLGDCLLSGVKVLMNLTNGNPVGCSQVTSCGGFNSLSSLLIANYPWLRPADSMDTKSCDDHKVVASPIIQSGGDSDQDLDLLVTVLGVLCNLVEKDLNNRASLASLKVKVPSDVSSSREGKLWQETGVLGLLCSLFLLKQGAGEAAEVIESKRALEMDEEVKQGQAEAEDMIVEAYTALLLAFLSKESDTARMRIAQLLPGEDLKILVPVLERFVAFHMSLNMISEETHSVVTDVIESCKRPSSSRPVM